MEAKHTPGPWTVWDVDQSIGTVTTADGEVNIAQAMMVKPAGSKERNEERKANTRLIAASPELLEALIEVSASLSWLAFGECRAFHDRRIMNAAEATGKAKAAIAKATT